MNNDVIIIPNTAASGSRPVSEDDDLLYHYTSLDVLIKIASSREVWASNIHYLNDGTEFAYAFDLLRADLDRVAKREPFRAPFLEQVRNHLSAREKVNVFVASFSEDGDLLSQWRAYCPSGQGVSCGVSLGSLRDAASRQAFSIEKCIYDRVEQYRLISHLVDQFLMSYDGTDSHNKESDDAEASYFVNNFTRVAPRLKDPAFREEREWRVISPVLPLAHPQVDYRQGKSFIVPYFRFRLPERNGKLDLTDFFVGPTPNMWLSATAVTSLAQARGLNWHTTTASRVPYRSW